MSSTTGSGPAWPTWTLDAAVGGAVLLVGLVVAADSFAAEPRLVLAAVALLVAAAVGLCRVAPGVALLLAWTLGVLHLVGGIELDVVELALAGVAFGCARWGSVPVVVISAVSIPVAAVVALLGVGTRGFSPMFGFGGGLSSVLRTVYAVAPGLGGRAIAALVGLVLLAAPWLAGLAMRFYDRAQASSRSQRVAEAQATQAVSQRDQAEEIAELRDRQAQLARDVHDVVGHSLATIIAQADAGQYAGDTGTLQQALAGIAASARTSLADVRLVLATDAESRVARGNDLDELIDGVRSSGHEVECEEHGARRPLAPELETVSYRVLQEMLTNAIKHGSRTEPIVVERHWEGELRIEVRNTIEQETAPIRVAGDAADGTGVEGMRRRLESVGGRLDVRRRDRGADAGWTATAWIPLRSIV